MTAVLNIPRIENYRKIRFLKDRLTTWAVTTGGLAVIGTLLLIFLYLLYEVLPLFQSASIHRVASYEVPLTAGGSRDDKTLFVAMEEQGEVAFRLTDRGQFVFFKTEDGQIVADIQLSIPVGAKITSFAMDTPESRRFALGLDNGSVLIAKHNYRISYPDDKRLITPRIDYPYGRDPIEINTDYPVSYLAYRDGEESLTIAVDAGLRQLKILKLVKEVDFLSEEVTLEREVFEYNYLDGPVSDLEIDVDQRWLFLVENKNNVKVLNLRDDPITVVSNRKAGEYADSVAVDKKLVYTDMVLLLGGISLLTADSSGAVVQSFMARDAQGRWDLETVREFSQNAARPSWLATEQRRKGFLAFDDTGQMSIFHSTSHRTLLSKQVLPAKPSAFALGPRADTLLLIDEQQQVSIWEVENEHPDVSWSALWNEVWYESYPGPDHIWQSSSSSNDFEPKFSLTPLAFGTLKAAFYTMLLAAPLAICGAIYTAYFMAAGMRRKVKPLIELMEALPTVILGFLAGIWLAPFIENTLPGVFSLFIFIPIGILAFGFLWNSLSKSFPDIFHAIKPGYEAAFLLPVVVGLGWFGIAFSGTMELWLFDGDMRHWITHDLGVSFDQRNSLVVGIAMGIAVIPTIFSITEDAIFSVPKHLSNGSLALGASPWQTLVGVVLPTASPGIFSALMIGMGRAVGETMIVLMATGNTPIMDANIFEGMRTLSANIAVEVPEAEVNSTHFRVLYLSAFFLFMFTFVVNTMAELVRQRLRKRYGSL